MKKKVRLKDIANELDISIVTVSKALRGLYGVNEETRRRVLEAAKRLHYGGYAEVAGSQPERGIYCALYDPRHGLNPHAMSLFFGLHQALQRLGSELTVIAFGGDTRDDADEGKLRNGGFRGLFLIGHGIANDTLEMLCRLSVPLVALDMEYPYWPVDCVMANDAQGAFLAVRHLASKGHREIGFVGDSTLAPSFRERCRGFMDALGHNNLTVYPEHIHDLRFKQADGSIDFSEALNVLNGKRLPSAFFCANDFIAGTIHTGLSARGMTASNPLSLIGFDNLNIVHWQRDSLTTIEYPREEAAQRAVELMQWREKNPQARRQKLLIETMLVERKSVADLRV